jgi:hypothetical protein
MYPTFALIFEIERGGSNGFWTKIADGRLRCGATAARLGRYQLGAEELSESTVHIP